MIENPTRSRNSVRKIIPSVCFPCFGSVESAASAAILLVVPEFYRECGMHVARDQVFLAVGKFEYLFDEVRAGKEIALVGHQ